MRSHSALACLCSALLLTLPACGPAEQADAETQPSAAEVPAEAPEISALRQTAQKYTDVQVALAEGYVPDPSGMCITAEMEGLPASMGAMGIHYLRPDLLGITGTSPRVAGTGTHTDFGQPAILMYEPQADGSLQLVGAENLVFAAGWTAAGQTAPPVFVGAPYVHMLDDPATPVDEAHGFEEHYELHAWVVRDNPNGLFTPFNPAVTCQHAQMPAMPSGN